jgi:hypothetical protein
MGRISERKGGRAIGYRFQDDSAAVGLLRQTHRKSTFSTSAEEKQFPIFGFWGAGFRAARRTQAILFAAPGIRRINTLIFC